MTSEGLLENYCGCEKCPYYRHKKFSAQSIKACWDVEGYSWVYKTSIPHVTFNIFEGGEPYCRGIVFSMNNLS